MVLFNDIKISKLSFWPLNVQDNVT